MAARWYAGVGMVTGAMMMVSALAHGSAGWAQFVPMLEAPGLAPDVVGALHVGWMWGSFAMAGSAVIVLRQSWLAWNARPIDHVVLAAVALTFAVYGLWAWVMRDFRPHMLSFVATGLCAAAPVLAARKHAAPRDADGGTAVRPQAR